MTIDLDFSLLSRRSMIIALSRRPSQKYDMKDLTGREFLGKSLKTGSAVGVAPWLRQVAVDKLSRDRRHIPSEAKLPQSETLLLLRFFDVLDIDPAGSN